MSGSGYWGLLSIIESNRIEQATYNSEPPDACPNDGTPLVTGNYGGIRECPMGDYEWRGGPRLT